MKVKVTLVRPGGDQVDLALTVEPVTPIADVARELHNADPRRTGAVLTESGSMTLRLHGVGAPRALDTATTVADAGLASGAVVSLAPSGSVAPAAEGAAATVTIVAGQGTGTRYSIPVGSSTIGRDRSNRVFVDDPLVSKLHARLNVSDIVEVVDAGSANGTFVNEQQVDRAILTRGDRVAVGDSILTVDLVAGVAAIEQGGSVHFNRSPRLEPAWAGPTIKAPEPPERQQRQPFPWVALLAPLVLGVVMYFVSQNILSIVMIAATPVLLAGGWVGTWIAGKRSWRTAQQQYAETVDAVGAELDRLHEAERASRLVEAPGTADALEATKARGPLLWTRRPEAGAFLSLRLGVGDMPSRIVFEMPHERKGAPELWHLVEELHARATTVAAVPVVEDLQESGSIGVAGPADLARGIVRGLVAQLTGLHSPVEVVLVAMASTGSAGAWDWLKWLPHVGSAFSPLKSAPLATGGPAATALISEIEELIAQRTAVEKPGIEIAPLPAVVVLVEDDAPVERARLVGLAERGPAAGVHVLWVAASAGRIPAACRTVVETNPATGQSSASYVRSGLLVAPIQCEPVAADDALGFARSLAPVVDAGARADDASDLPGSISLLALLGTELANDPEAVVARWQETNSIATGPRATGIVPKSRGLRAVFGQGATEPFALDLRTDGPHALVGGTTGSGKSEFLQAWVLGMAAAHSPQRLTFLFVDYKGGAAFSECINLPHSVGLVTDLSPHLVRRALMSLRAELHRREHLFQQHKVKDIVEFERKNPAEAPPSLVIVVDEFAALATEVPEFVDGVVDVAQRGRSLGLHLILATQRPAGVIRDNLRANTNLRIALRMADEADSDDVLGDKMAAGFDPSIPGRGAAKTGPGRIRNFQAGYAGGWTSDEPEPSRIAIDELRFGAPVAWEPPADPEATARQERVSQGPNDIKRIVASVRAAAATAEIPEPRKPWLPELAETYDFARLPNPRTDAELLLGVVDDAGTQSQPIVAYYPDRDGNVAIIGTGGAGKSTAMRTIAVASAVTVRGGPVHIYGLDFGANGLQMLEVLPHVGSIISGDDDERVTRLLRWLRDLVDDRAVRFSEARAGNIAEYRKNANRPDEPRILLLLDGIGAFRDAYEATTNSAWFSVFSQIATDGRQVGVHVIVSGDRGGAIPTSLNSSIQRRLVLRLANPDDYVMLGVESDILGPASPPGRGILDGRETQIAVLGGDGNIAIQARQLEALAEAMTKAGVRSAPSIERLADAIPLSAIATAAGAGIPIGVADDTLQPLSIEPSGAFVVAGPPSSGRTTVLATIAQSLQARRPATSLVLLSPRRSALHGTATWRIAADAPAALDAAVAELGALVDGGTLQPGQLALFLEHLSEFTGTSAEYELERIVKGLIKQEQFVVAESETSTWSQAYTLGQPLRAGRRGLLVQPDESDGDLLLNTPLGRFRRGTFPPGRGFLIVQGRARKLQVAQPEETAR